MKNFYLAILTLLLISTLPACKKDEKTTPSINGTYLVSGEEGGHTGNGTIEINGNTMNINVQGVLTLNGIQFSVSNQDMTFADQYLGQAGSSQTNLCWEVIGTFYTGNTKKGSHGTITSTSLILTLQSKKYCSSSQIFTCKFNGSK